MSARLPASFLIIVNQCTCLCDSKYSTYARFLLHFVAKRHEIAKTFCIFAPVITLLMRIITSERDKQIEKERKGVVELLLKKNGLTRRQLVEELVGFWAASWKNDEIVRIVRELQHRFNVIDFTNRDIDAALVETGTDIEDNVQYVLAMKQKCGIIVTNNYKDYRHIL